MNTIPIQIDSSLLKKKQRYNLLFNQLIKLKLTKYLITFTRKLIVNKLKYFFFICKNSIRDWLLITYLDFK